MEHVVFFPAPDGSPTFRRLPSLDEAVRLVEHLRNVEGVEDVSCHALTEVPLAFRAYYRVEVGTVEGGPVDVGKADAGGADAGYVGADQAAPQQPLQDVPSVEQAGEPVAASANGRRAAGANSLGFFA